MKKFLILILIILVAICMASVYGVLHDQLTYRISNEYYTLFKFWQFGLIDSQEQANFDPIFKVGLVGVMATWWMGIPIGLIIGLVGLMFNEWKTMLKVCFQGLVITLVVAFVTGLIGLAFGWFYLADTNPDWFFPDGLIDRKRYIAVGSMHNFSYLGGIVGLVFGIVYMMRHKRVEQPLGSRREK